MIAIELPAAEVSNPSCGACGSETSYDGDCFECDGCQLRFAKEDLTASFIDDEVPPCGIPCDNDWHKPGRIDARVSYECRACALPETHTSEHWTGCTPHALNRSNDGR